MPTCCAARSTPTVQLIEDAQTQYRAAQDQIRATLRQEPFDVEAMRAAMAKTRAARQSFDQVIQGVFAFSAVADVAGRPQRAGRLAAGPKNHEQPAVEQANFPSGPGLSGF